MIRKIVIILFLMFIACVQVGCGYISQEHYSSDDVKHTFLTPKDLSEIGENPTDWNETIYFSEMEQPSRKERAESGGEVSLRHQSNEQFGITHIIIENYSNDEAQEMWQNAVEDNLAFNSANEVMILPLDNIPPSGANNQRVRCRKEGANGATTSCIVYLQYQNYFSTIKAPLSETTLSPEQFYQLLSTIDQKFSALLEE